MKKLIILLIVVTSLESTAQTKYPKEYLPGVQIKLKSVTDTLWVMDSKTMNKYVDYWVKYKWADTNNQLYVRELNTLKKVIRNKNQVIRNKNEEIKESDKKSESLIADKKDFDKKIEKSKLVTKLGVSVGIIVGFLVGWLAM